MVHPDWVCDQNRPSYDPGARAGREALAGCIPPASERESKREAQDALWPTAGGLFVLSLFLQTTDLMIEPAVH